LARSPLPKLFAQHWQVSARAHQRTVLRAVYAYDSERVASEFERRVKDQSPQHPAQRDPEVVLPAWEGEGSEGEGGVEGGSSLCCSMHHHAADAGIVIVAQVVRAELRNLNMALDRFYRCHLNNWWEGPKVQFRPPPALPVPIPSAFMCRDVWEAAESVSLCPRCWGCLARAEGQRGLRCLFRDDRHREVTERERPLSSLSL
jgi:hypothetical protein